MPAGAVNERIKWKVPTLSPLGEVTAKQTVRSLFFFDDAKTYQPIKQMSDGDLLLVTADDLFASFQK